MLKRSVLSLLVLILLLASTASADPGQPWGDPTELEPKCAQGDAEACHNLGHALELINDDPTPALRAFEASCGADPKATSGEACSDVARYLSGAIEPDSARIAAFRLEACHAGDGLGCFNAAIHHRDGDGVQQDLELASELHGRGCHLGEARACRYLAYLHHEGEEGVEKDHDLSLGLYAQACDLGLASACMDLADCHEDTGEDLMTKLGLLQKACEQQSGAGCLAFARLVESSDLGLPKEKKTIRRYRALACEYGEAEACP